MKHLSGILAVGFVTLICGAIEAQAANVIDADCAQLGATTMADDQHSLVACLLKDAVAKGNVCSNQATSAVPNGNCKWKSMMKQASINYAACTHATKDNGVALNVYFTQFGGPSLDNTNIVCPRNYVLVGLDSESVSDAVCCPLS